ncbi:MAG: hypothetical protein A2W98_06510 [Bacteroidetes bacterium GWF2_33_38]|nr:MAG: hypothetical protein A2W98_06510 [Bacteroidetes bacterium GWF2_33_38]OFY72954.1 MAG: hypothetical protein A2265_10605 [Bacteroidetes bacterium RIFOXYA12_FULL_33_9]OFY92311.1 MAG: hypothetical protein A2236_01730 [Bacteroidetes bacterium RIFOXYA2_FULL_33_7]
MTKFYQKRTPNFSSIYKLALFAFFVFTIFSCNKEDEIGLDLIPQKEMLNLEFCDTLLLKSYTVYNDTFSTKNKTLSLVGSYHDPIFGKTAAGFLTEFRLSSTDVEFDETSYVNSFTLNMVVDDYYGDISTPMTINVYNISREINTETEFTEFDKNQYVTEDSLITSFTFTPSQNGQDTLIKINLPIEFANRFLGYSDQEFIDNAKGLYVTINENETSESILYIDLVSSKSNLDLEYTYFDGEDSVTTNFLYLINSACERQNIFTHNYEGTEISSEITLGENSINEVNYIQAMRGVNTIIEFPDLKSIVQDQKIAIMKAELVITESEDYVSSDYQACEKLNIIVLNDSLEYLNAPDYDILGSEHFNSEYINNSYVFNMTAYTQGLITSDVYDNSKLIVSAFANTISANRVVVNSGNSATNRIKLKLYYLKL